MKNYNEKWWNNTMTSYLEDIQDTWRPWNWYDATTGGQKWQFLSKTTMSQDVQFVNK